MNASVVVVVDQPIDFSLE